MTPAAITKVLKSLAPGDPVEILWSDACTIASRWMDHEDAKKLTLAMILTRGTLVGIEDGAVRVALDCGVLDNGTVGDFHGIGVIERGAIKDIAKLKRMGRKR